MVKPVDIFRNKGLHENIFGKFFLSQLWNWNIHIKCSYLVTHHANFSVTRHYLKLLNCIQWLINTKCAYFEYFSKNGRRPLESPNYKGSIIWNNITLYLRLYRLNYIQSKSKLFKISPNCGTFENVFLKKPLSLTW